MPILRLLAEAPGFTRNDMKDDRSNCLPFGPCGLGKQAVWLGGFFLERTGCIPIAAIRRIYKRVAMSRGGFTGKGVFGSIPYLVVEHSGGTSVCRFRIETDIDAMLAAVRNHFPGIPTMSEKAAACLEAERKAEEAALRDDLSPQAERTLAFLRQALAFLEAHKPAADRLSAASRAARTGRLVNPSYKWAAATIIALSFIATAWGAYDRFVTGPESDGLWISLIGIALIFLFAGTRVIPTARINHAALEGELFAARKTMDGIIAEFPGFPLPARYAHPAALTRMIRSVRQGRSETIEEAFEDMKAVLQATDSSVRVSQQQYDEIVAIKPMFLLENYR